MGDRTGLLNEAYRWPKAADGNVNVPIEISSSFGARDQAIIINAIVELHKYTCIRFVWKNSNHKDYIYVEDGNGCWSYLGMLDGKQTLSLDSSGCLTKPTIQHEFIHALGYTHMHNHMARDQYVTIHWNNIESRHRSNFEKVQAWQFDNFGTPYDYYSVMHYRSNTFGVGGRDTIVPKDSSKKHVIGNVSVMSPGDIQRINKMYNCLANKTHVRVPSRPQP